MLSIQTNMLAWNAGRQYEMNVKKNGKNVEKLSSGYKINRAADDAAGLAISEKMRRQIRGLKQGSDNIQDGISLIQVADGAMGEVDGFSAFPKYHTNSAGKQVPLGATLNLSAWNGFQNDAGEAVNCFDKVKELIVAQEADSASTEDQKRHKQKLWQMKLRRNYVPELMVCS